MPFVRLTIADPHLTAETQQSLAAEFTQLVEHDLDKEPDDTVVQVNLVPPDLWFVGGFNGVSQYARAASDPSHRD